MFTAGQKLANDCAVFQAGIKGARQLNSMTFTREVTAPLFQIIIYRQQDTINK